MFVYSEQLIILVTTKCSAFSSNLFVKLTAGHFIINRSVNEIRKPMIIFLTAAADYIGCTFLCWLYPIIVLSTYLLTNERTYNFRVGWLKPIMISTGYLVISFTRDHLFLVTGQVILVTAI